MNKKERLNKKRDKMENSNRNKSILKDIQKGVISKNSCCYLVNRDWQNMFGQFLDEAGFDEYGYYEGNRLKFKTDKGGFENEVFLLNPYDWSFDYDGDGEIEAPPNFIFKKDNIRIEWYKYPLRSSYSNNELTEDKLKIILSECLKSVKKD